MLKYINFNNLYKINSEADNKMQEIRKYYLELTKKQHNIMTNKLKINNNIYNDKSINNTIRNIKKGI